MTNAYGSVYIDGIVIGSVTGTYIDDSAEQQSETINNVTVNITVYIDTTIYTDIIQYDVIGSGVLQYQDYVAYNGGGSRTISISDNILLDSSTIGSVNVNLTDNYSAVVSQPPSPPPTPTPTPTTTTTNYLLAILLILLLLLLAVSRRRTQARI